MIAKALSRRLGRDALCIKEAVFYESIPIGIGL